MEHNILADKLFSVGLTFDDVLIAPRYSSVVPSEVDVQTRLTARIAMHVPILSSPMDTVTESAMAIALAQEGGLGVIHKNMSIERQTDLFEDVTERAIQQLPCLQHEKVVAVRNHRLNVPVPLRSGRYVSAINRRPQPRRRKPLSNCGCLGIVLPNIRHEDARNLR